MTEFKAVGPLGAGFLTAEQISAINQQRGMVEPTSDQCAANAPIPLPDGRTGYACWYPQMGGYTSRCVVVDDDGCFDAWVWHDGEFPFADSARDPVYGQRPRELHHCDPGQFIGFGEMVQRLLGGEDERNGAP